MALSNSCSSVKVGMDLSKPFDTVRDFTQGDFFNFVMESVLRKTGVHRNAAMGRTKPDVTVAFSAIGQESNKIGLAVYEGKTKYMLSTSRDVRRIDSQIMADNYTFDIVWRPISLEIKSTNTLASKCYCNLNRKLSSRDLSRTIKLILYKTLILPALL